MVYQGNAIEEEAREIGRGWDRYTLYNNLFDCACALFVGLIIFAIIVMSCDGIAKHQETSGQAMNYPNIAADLIDVVPREEKPEISYWWIP